MKQFSLLIVLCVGMLVAGQAQVFFQNTMHPYVRFAYNPAAAGFALPGMEEGANFTLMGRQQWLGIEGAPRTPLFAFQTPLPQKYGAIGAVLASDQTGPISNSWLDVSYAYRLELGERLRLSIGVAGGVKQVAINPEGFIYDQSGGIDPIIPLATQGVVVPNLNAGLYLTSVDPATGREGNYFLGISGQNLLEPNIEGLLGVSGIGDDSNVDRSFALMGGYRFDLSTRLSLQPMLMMQTDGVGAPQTMASVYLNYKPIVVGINYRMNSGESVGGMVGFNISDRTFFGYSYDYPTTALSAAGDLHSHEIILSYTLPGTGARGRGKGVDV
ncbi:MAG: PorP/SprF family type IX secretion system membrane protein, partial [Bacteroidota bacterium]